MALTNEEQLLKNNTALVSIGLRLSYVNKEQNQLLQQQVERNNRLFLYCMGALDLIGQRENPTTAEEAWLKKVREELKLRI